MKSPPRTIILPYTAAEHLLTLLLAARQGDVNIARKTASKLEAIDPATATLTPILYAPYADTVELITPWLEDLRIYSPLVIHAKPESLTTILHRACENNTKLILVTRSGTRDESRSAEERLRIIAKLPRSCIKVTIRETIHTKRYSATIGKVRIEVLTTANLTASEIWKTRTGDNESRLNVLVAEKQ